VEWGKQKGGDSRVLLSKTLVRLVLFRRWDDGGVKLKESRRGKKKVGDYRTDMMLICTIMNSESVYTLPREDQGRTNWITKRGTRGPALVVFLLCNKES